MRWVCACGCLRGCKLLRGTRVHLWVEMVVVGVCACVGPRGVVSGRVVVRRDGRHCLWPLWWCVLCVQLGEAPSAACVAVCPSGTRLCHRV